MAILSNDDKQEVENLLTEMEADVTVSLFTSDDCQFCDETVELNEELAALNDHVDLEVHDLESDAAEEFDAAKYGVGPVTVLSSEGVSGVKYFGIPSGMEFSSYLQDLIAVSTGQTELDEGVLDELADIDEDVEIKVFVTPTCPHCPGAVQTAHSFAMENENVQAEMIEAQQFMDVAQEYGVRGVPQINVNGTDGQFTGNLPPHQFVDEVKKALQ